MNSYTIPQVTEISEEEDVWEDCSDQPNIKYVIEKGPSKTPKRINSQPYVENREQRDLIEDMLIRYCQQKESTVWRDEKESKTMEELNAEFKEGLKIDQMAANVYDQYDKLMQLADISNSRCYLGCENNYLEEWEEAVDESIYISDDEREENYTRIEELKEMLIVREHQILEWFKTTSLSIWQDRHYRDTLDTAARKVLNDTMSLRLERWSRSACEVLSEEDYALGVCKLDKLQEEFDDEVCEIVQAETSLEVTDNNTSAITGTPGNTITTSIHKVIPKDITEEHENREVIVLATSMTDRDIENDSMTVYISMDVADIF